MEKRGGKRIGAGRKPIADNITVTCIKMPTELWCVLPYPKAEYVRQAVQEKLNRDGIMESENIEK